MDAPPPPTTPTKTRREAAKVDWQEVSLKLSTGLTLPTFWWHPPAEHLTPVSELSSAAVLCLHGAGDVALCWAQVARRLLRDERLGGNVIVAADLRGHGGAVVEEPLDESLRLDKLIPDVLSLIKCISDRVEGEGLILVGHSLGGSVAARAAQEALKMRPPLPVRAVALLESVEGTATEALPRSIAWMQARPQSFGSLEDAIAWSLSSGMLTNPQAARENLPPRLKHTEEDGKELWSWITDVSQASSCWPHWFEGLSALFVALPMPKVLVVGSVDRMDATLEAAHMQGRFRLEVIPHPGHFIHEDRPDEVAEAIAKFLLQLKQQEAAFAKLMDRKASPSSSPSAKRQRTE
ncbi:unnamed protein product [Effrenium voratum]|uniref:Protein phosphatase methylesterase 1 n=1 Tax=Effrenium voratum TaxID=2562239 RepID=A0AA36NBW5_9DINO|nr:unnamed protein product [Effrenium voratum]CAJ1461813.1 unnamed protein product [Effrenium voratum]